MICQGNRNLSWLATSRQSLRFRKPRRNSIGLCAGAERQSQRRATNRVGFSVALPRQIYKLTSFRIPFAQGDTKVVSRAYIARLYKKLSSDGNLKRFAERTRQRYTEGTLQRLLSNPDRRVREAALVALRLLGTMDSAGPVAAYLRQPDAHAPHLAEGALWAIWFRADRPEHNQELQQLARLIANRSLGQALTGLNRLIQKAPRFAEAYNQRAIVHFHRSDFRRSIRDCLRTLHLNPDHFGAQSGLAQCYWHLNQPIDALNALRRARRLNPHLRGINEQIEALEVQIKEDRGLNDDQGSVR